MEDTKYRYCCDEVSGNCKYMILNEYGVETCSIDHVVQVKFYGCTPAEAIARRKDVENG